MGNNAGVGDRQFSDLVVCVFDDCGDGPMTANPKQDRTRDRKWLDSFRDTPCEFYGCARPDTVPAHMSLGSYARGMKAPDSHVAALCHEHHMMADSGAKEERQWVWLNVLKTLMSKRYWRWKDD